jgi:hypothetical protein
MACFIFNGMFSMLSKCFVLYMIGCNKAIMLQVCVPGIVFSCGEAMSILGRKSSFYFSKLIFQKTLGCKICGCIKSKFVIVVAS